MNNFQPKYIKISAEYLEKQLRYVQTKEKSSLKLQKKKESKLNQLLHALFRS
ncbi:hypothetical protein [Sulfurimonas sp.]